MFSFHIPGKTKYINICGILKAIRSSKLKSGLAQVSSFRSRTSLVLPWKFHNTSTEVPRKFCFRSSLEVPWKCDPPALPYYWQKKCASAWLKDLRTPLIIDESQDQGTLILTHIQYEAQVTSHYIFL